MVGHVELVGLAFVVVAALGDRIDGECLALEQIALVLLVLEDAEDGAVVPVAGLVFGLPPPLLELAGEDGRPDALDVAVEDIANDLGLLRVDADLLRLLIVIVAEAGVEPHELALAHHHRKALLHVLGGVLDLLLGDGRKDGDEKLALLGGGVDVLLLEADVDPLLLEDADVVERVHGVSREARDRFDEDEVDLARHAVADHPHEIRALLGGGPGDTLVGVDPGIDPVGVVGDERLVVGHLRFEGIDLLLVGGRDPAIGADAEFLLGVGQGLGGLLAGLDDRHVVLWLFFHGSVPLISPSPRAASSGFSRRRCRS